MTPDAFRCYLVRKTGKGEIAGGLDRRPTFELPAGDVLIRVAYSSLNYKDALAARGHPGVARRFPHVPGIDAAGTVQESSSADFRPGDKVLVTSYELGAERWGGWADYVRVPADWVLPLPKGLSLEESMILGTAGLTAGLCVRALRHHEIAPESGEVVVTGATGGVGTLAVRLLAKLGYVVVAVSGKAEKHEWLRRQGAARVVTRKEMLDPSNRPLLSARWAGAVDTVGGAMLATLLRSMRSEGCVASCGLVGGDKLATTVYPFILRGVTLAGIDSAWCPRVRREEIWHRLAIDWKLDGLTSIRTVIQPEQIGDYVGQILSGQITGRVIIDAHA
ncbi:MAG: YhdH/YhfP family quinone oxidoreductase [Planctomycetota bacterium]